MYGKMALKPLSISATAVFGLSLLDVSSFSGSVGYAVLTAVTHKSLLYTLCSREGECGKLALIIATFGWLISSPHSGRARPLSVYKLPS